ncbi:MAG: outer membrane receptor protein involved in Fe transport [Polaribacter sp.]|jgi:outer membrane receptor protein involved in Fe transport
MKKLLTYLYLSFLSLPFLTAQQGTLTGLVLDTETGEVLIAATIRSGDIGTVTTIEGRYELQLPPGEQPIEISYVGFETQRLLVTIVAGETKDLDVKMGAAATLLQTATVSSSKFAKPLGEVTVSLEILKADLINNTNATNITQPLQKISGVTIINGQANIRGGSGWSYGAGSRVLLLIDDIPALQADAGFPNWVDVPVENIAQVEIVKGAASALYGSSAMNGIINIKTAYATSEPYTRISTFYKHYDSPKDESLKWWGKELTLYERNEDNMVIDSTKFTPSVFGGQKGYNRPGQLGLSVAHRQKLGKTDLILGAYSLLSESYRQANYSNYARFNAGIKHRISDKLSVGFNSNFNRGKGRSTFYWQRQPDEVDNPGSYLPDVTALSNSNRFRYTIDPYLNYFDNSGNQHKVLTRFYGISNKNDNNQGNTSQLYYTEYQFLKSWEKYDLNLTTGVVGTWTNVDAELYNGIYKAANYAAFLQVDKKIQDKLNLSFGARYEQNKLTNPDYLNADTIVFKAGTDKDARPVFRAGANYQVAKYTFLRTSWGQGYRFPVLAEKYIMTNAGGVTVIPNPELNPETGWSAEIGIKQGFKIGGFNGYIDAALFRSDYKNMMEFTVTQDDQIFNNLIAFQSKNIGNTSIKGVDFSLAGQGKTGDWTTSVLAGYTYIKPQYTNFDSIKIIQPPVTTSDKNVLKYRSRHSVKFDIETKYKMFSLGFSTIYNSKIEAMDPVIGAINRIKEYLDENQQKGSTKMDIRFAIQPTKKIKVSLLGENILNREYVSRPGLLDAPRSYTVRFDYTL